MSTITVNTTTDSSHGPVVPTSPTISLRDAIVYSQIHPGTTIDIPAGTYTLGSDLPLISQSTTFVGSTSGKTIIDGQSSFRGFLISGIAANGQNAAATTVGISDIAFRNTVATGGAGTNGGGGGLGAGGAVFVGPAANVTLTNVGVSGAKAVGGAGSSGGGFGGATGGGGGLGGDGGTGAGFGSGGGGGGGGILFAGGAANGGGGGGGGITSAGHSPTATAGGAGGSGLYGLGGGGGGGGLGTTAKGGAAGGTGAQMASNGGGITYGQGGYGGFGGGGGGGAGGPGGNGQGYGLSGGFGGGGGGGGNYAGFGGFGGGGGAGTSFGGQGGFGGGGGSGSKDGGPRFGNAGFAAGIGTSGGGGGGGALGGAVFVAAGGTLTINGTMDESGGDATGGAAGGGGAGVGTGFGAGIFYEGGTAAAPATLTFGGTGAQSIADAITDLNGAAGNATTANGFGHAGGVVALAQIGTGTLTLSGINAYTGGTTIAAGSLSISTDANLGAASGGVAFTGGTLETTATLSSGRAITLGGTTGNNFVQVDTGTTTLSGTISGGLFGQLKKTGAGTLMLSGANTFTGNTFVYAGTLSISAGANLGSSASYLFFEGGMLETTATLTLGRGIILDSPGTVQVDAGTTTLSGVVSGSNSLTKTGVGTMTLSGSNTYKGGTSIVSGTLAVAADGNLGDAAGVLTVGGTLEATAGFSSGRDVRLASNATVQVDNGTLSLSGQVSGNYALTKTGSGTLVLAGGNNIFGPTTISAGALELATAASAGRGDITFGSGNATLGIDSGAQSSGVSFGNVLSGFNAGSVLNLKGFVVTSTSYANGTLTLTGVLGGSAQTTTERYNFRNLSSTTFVTSSDGNGGTNVMVCYAAGTRIRAVRGRMNGGDPADVAVEVDIPVEDLRRGDLVVTAAGAQRPVRWLGRRTVNCRRHPRPSEAMPVRISAHAFGPNHPARDLYVSPGHAICVDVLGDVLIPAGALVNGSTIRQVEVEIVTYWHVELDGHEVILAENLPAESYIDCGNRSFFEAAVTRRSRTWCGARAA